MVAQPFWLWLMKRLAHRVSLVRSAAFAALGQTHADEIKNRFPQVLRRVGGYNIDALIPDAMANRPGGMPGDGINIKHLLVGRKAPLPTPAV